MMCSHTPFIVVSLIDENLMIRVLANALSEVELLIYSIQQGLDIRILLDRTPDPSSILVLMYMTLRRLDRFQCS